MVLLTTISMIVIMTMLVLSLMQAVFLYFKLNNQLIAKHKAFYRLEAMANQLMTTPTNQLVSDCIMTETDPNQIVEMLLHHQGCSMTKNNQPYDYLIDDLGLFPCLQIQVANKIYSSHHWLMTVAMAELHPDMLQIRIAKPINTLDCEHQKVHRINSGVISWRHLVTRQ